MIPGRQRGRWRRFGAALGVWALLSHTLVILIHRPPMAAPAELAMAMTMGPDCPMVMHGGSPPASDDPAQPPRKPPPVCPICQSLQLNGALLAPAQPVVSVALGAVVVLDRAPETWPPAAPTNERARARAPPARAASLTATLDG
jgi:hypothetical protein